MSGKGFRTLGGFILVLAIFVGGLEYADHIQENEKKKIVKDEVSHEVLQAKYILLKNEWDVMKKKGFRFDRLMMWYQYLEDYENTPKNLEDEQIFKQHLEVKGMVLQNEKRKAEGYRKTVFGVEWGWWVGILLAIGAGGGALLRKKKWEENSPGFEIALILGFFVWIMSLLVSGFGWVNALSKGG
jgi:hypothetical protein